MLCKENFLVVGGSGSIGNAIIHRLLKSGNNQVYATYNNQKIFIECDRLEIIQCDVTKHDYSNIVIPTIHHIVYCVGVSCYGNLFEAKYDEFVTQCDQQVYSPLEIIREYIKGENCLKDIVLIASDAGLAPNVNNSFYGLGKNMMISMANVLSKEFIKLGIRINVVAPGLTYSKMAENLCNNRNITILDEENRRIDKKLVDPEEIANLVYMLSMEESKHINGQVIEIKSGELS
jgi:3-oxoacyl-[acyl-carrier protein] reductase